MSKKTLIAIELADNAANVVLNKASEVLGSETCDVVTVVDPSTVIYGVDPTMTGKFYEEQYEHTMELARGRLQQLTAEANLPMGERIVLYGRVAHEIHELLASGDYDTLMIGSHGYHGWRRILGSKASSILHGTPVDTFVFAMPKGIDDKPAADAASD